MFKRALNDIVNMFRYILTDFLFPKFEDEVDQFETFKAIFAIYRKHGFKTTLIEYTKYKQEHREEKDFIDNFFTVSFWILSTGLVFLNPNLGVITLRVLGICIIEINLIEKGLEFLKDFTLFVIDVNRDDLENSVSDLGDLLSSW